MKRSRSDRIPFASSVCTWTFFYFLESNVLTRINVLTVPRTTNRAKRSLLINFPSKVVINLMRERERKRSFSNGTQERDVLAFLTQLAPFPLFFSLSFLLSLPFSFAAPLRVIIYIIVIFALLFSRASFSSHRSSSSFRTDPSSFSAGYRCFHHSREGPRLPLPRSYLSLLPPLFLLFLPSYTVYPPLV